MRFYRFDPSESFFSDYKLNEQLNELSDYFSDTLEIIQQRFGAARIRAERNKCSDEVIKFIKKSHIYCFKALLNLQKITFMRIKGNRIPRLEDVTDTVERNIKKRERFVNIINFNIDYIQINADRSFLLSIGDKKDIYII